jgi:hypothetical protein
VVYVSAGKGLAGTLSGSFSPIASGSNVNLSAVGKLDWVHWGFHTEASVNRKACENLQIGNLSPAYDTNNPNGYSQIYQFSDNANGYSWQDGQPTPGATNTTTGDWAYGIPALGTGFEFSVPADTTPRTLQVFVGVFSGRGTLQVSLSDNSASAYSDSSLANLFGNGPGGVYTLNYSANSSGQSLRIRWTLSQAVGPNAPSANVTLQAAALTANGANNPPFSKLIQPGQDATFAEPATVNLQATAQDFDGDVTNVAFYANEVFLGEVATPPFNFSWPNVSHGHYALTAIASDNTGTFSCGRPVEVFVYGTGGAQTNSVTTSPSSVDLTAEGTADWTHWGLTTNSSFDYKNLVSRKISNYSLIGNSSPIRYSDNFTSFVWSDGTPTPQTAGTPTGLYVTGTGNGFSLTAPADTNSRTLRLYVGGYGVQGELQAYLSDLSAKPFADTSVSNYYDSVYVVYTINYVAASAGQHLIVNYRSLNLFDEAYGNVTLQSATLGGGPAEPLPFSLVNPRRIGNDFILSFNTQTGFNYTAEFSDSILNPNWDAFATVPGNGGALTVTNYDVPFGLRFYRVRIP